MTPRPVVWKYVGGLAPVILVWAILVAWLASVLVDRANWSDQSDEAAVREWLDEARNFRKTLPELAREYVRLSEAGAGGQRLGNKVEELQEQVQSLAEPTRLYLNQLPLFPEVYRIEVEFFDGRIVDWDSTLPRPKRTTGGRVRVLEYTPLGPGDRRAVIRCEYRMHAFNRRQRQEEERRRTGLVAVALLAAATLLAGLFVARFLRRERQRDRQRYEADAATREKEAELLKTRLDRDAAELRQNELARQLLQQQLDAAALERRAAEAEREASDARTRLYANIGVMAGSYAHNIKNLLVRPNDLLARCVEVNGLSAEQQGMLGEVRSTLGTVTDRLQQILRTVRRDPSKQEATRVDLADLVRETAATWADLAREKWKIVLSTDAPAAPLPIDGDHSHIQQVLENLLFNARDATFEMRNHVRDRARAEANLDPAVRKQKLIDAAGWKGTVHLAVRRENDRIVLEVTDNGIGMTDDVRTNCLAAHFSTKRDNALYQGYSAGMGLGLSFVAVVLEHHGATLEIDSGPLRGATFRAAFPPAAG